MTCSAPSIVATASPAAPRKTSSRSSRCRGLALPAASSTSHMLVSDAPREGDAYAVTVVPSASNTGASVCLIRCIGRAYVNAY